MLFFTLKPTCKNDCKKSPNSVPNGPPEGGQNAPRSTKNRRQDAIKFCIHFGIDFCLILGRFWFRQWFQNRSQIGPKSVLKAVAEITSKRIRFWTFFGTIFRRSLIDFQNDFQCHRQCCSTRPYKAAISNPRGKTHGST